MPGKSLSSLTPNEPEQKQRPLFNDGTAAASASKSDAVLTTLGKPKIA